MSETTSGNIVLGRKVGKEKLQQAKQLRRGMTVAERVLWQRLRGNRLNGLHFRRQQVIAGFIVDFYCHAARLVIEVDGSIHEQQVEPDVERDSMLAAIMRITNEDVMANLPSVLVRILEATRIT